MARVSNAEKARRETERQESIKVEATRMMQEMLPTVIAQITSQLSDAKAAVAGGPQVVTAGDTNWAGTLAAAIVSAGDPKGRNRPVDPVVAESRKAAQKRMVELLVDLKAKGIRPVYVVRTKMFLNNTKIDPEWRDANKQFHATKIAWDRIPNQGMIPDDDNARAVFAQFQKSIGTVEAEGLPEAPWLSTAQPWVNTPDGIVLGRPIGEVPEIASATAMQTKGAAIFDDPRMTGMGAQGPRKETAVFGTIAPPVVEVS